MKIVYDKLAEAAYVYVSDKEIARTTEITEDIIIDIDEDGGIVGIELLNVSEIKDS